MLKNKVRALVPIVALVLAAACSAPNGPTVDLQEVAEASIDDTGEEADRSQAKRNTPLDQ